MKCPTCTAFKAVTLSVKQQHKYLRCKHGLLLQHCNVQLFGPSNLQCHTGPFVTFAFSFNVATAIRHFLATVLHKRTQHAHSPSTNVSPSLSFLSPSNLAQCSIGHIAQRCTNDSVSMQLVTYEVNAHSYKHNLWPWSQAKNSKHLCQNTDAALYRSFVHKNTS